MHSFFKKIFAPKAPEIVMIAADKIPALIQEKEQKAQGLLSSETRGHMQNIRNSQAQLQLIVNGIAGAEHDPALHPKLKSIAKNSLPLFVKAMNSSLSKELPEDIEAFYPAAVESVKGCLNSTRGQGRYLQVVFPEEMKSVKTGIDTIGRELNEITKSLAKYRKAKADIDAVQELYNALSDIRLDFSKSVGKEQRIRARLSETTDRIAAIEEEQKSLSSDRGMTEIAEQRAALAAIGKEKDEAARMYASLSMTASHVFGKAEKIAAKQHHPTEITALKKTLDYVSGHSIPDCTDLATAISASFPIALRMIESGEIVLKNKEERTIFSGTSSFIADISKVCSDVREFDEKFHAQEATLGRHPLILKTDSLDREKAQLGAMLAKEKHSLEELSVWREKTAEKFPVLTGQLRKKTEDIVGENVQLEIDDLMKS